jgi:nucleotide-binding universal stress UspA family protein
VNRRALVGESADEEVTAVRTTYRIVVGVGGSEGGRRALRRAVREAAARGPTVPAVIAWRWDTVDLPPYVAVAADVAEGRPADVLAAAAREADLLVLGSHGHGRMRHTVLGSVSEECVRKATCPVVVLPVGQDSGGRNGRGDRAGLTGLEKR